MLEQAWQQHVRDPLGRLKQILYQDGQQTEFEYDEQGRLTKAQNGQHTTEFEYNAAHQLCAQIQDGVKLEYDTAPNHHSLILPDGKNITYHLGKQHKLSHITVDNKELSRYEYDDKGFEVKQTLGAMELLQQYDPYGRLIEQRGMSLFASGAHNATLSSRRYLYDKAGRIAQIQRHFGGHQTFQYDNRNRLTDSTASDFSHQYQFDAASNLVLEPEKPQQSNPVYTLHYNTGDVDGVHFPRIVNYQLPGNHRKDTRYRYDERGNRILASHGNGIVQTHYRYDTQNQLIQLEYFTGPHTTLKLNFTYDALGRRCAKYVTTYSNNRPVSQYRIDFLWDGNVLLAEQKVELDITTEPEKHPKPKLDKPDAIYIHRPNSFEPLMQLRQPEPQEIPKQDYLPKPTYSVYYYLNDHLGTPQELLNKHGELVWQARTSPYGEILKLGTNKIPNPIRLPGQYEDKESGLYYNRFRYYSPQDGGYINRDPIGLLGGDNLYDYPRDPLGWADPFGLKECTGNSSKLAQPGEDLYVGTYNQVRRANIKSGLNPTHTPHHAIQNAVSSTTHGRGITINLKKELHELTWTYRRPMARGFSKEQYLARDIADLRKILRDAGYDRDVVNRQLKELIRQNKELWKS